MKPTVLKVGDRFRVEAACDPRETEDIFKVLSTPTGNHILSFDVERERDGVRRPMRMGAWVHVMIVEK